PVVGDHPDLFYVDAAGIGIDFDQRAFGAVGVGGIELYAALFVRLPADLRMTVLALGLEQRGVGSVEDDFGAGIDVSGVGEFSESHGAAVGNVGDDTVLDGNRFIGAAEQRRG